MNDVVIKKKYSFRLNALTVQLRIYILEQRIGMSVSGCGGGGGGRDKVWDWETMFSQLAKQSPYVVVRG